MKIIRVENISKKYTINRFGAQRGQTFREAIYSNLKNIISTERKTSSEFWALKDINFEVSQGEKIAILGKNGAGKSTFLKILSRITQPTSGRIELRGRVASLLEVGTGFHPELTGRENIYLNGAILGMKKIEIKRKFDEIVAFSGVENFLDVPVKRFSSGMKVRLAFSVAAHLEPEILIIDEVLAVGDAEFQNKCLRKMDEVSQHQGRTVIFVSHNIPAVQRLCPRTILLENGNLINDGPTTEVVERYIANIRKPEKAELAHRNDRRGLGKVRIGSLEILNLNRAPLTELNIGDSISVKIVLFNSYEVAANLRLNLSFFDIYGTKLISCDSNLMGQYFQVEPNSEKTFFCDIQMPNLTHGTYLINASIRNVERNFEQEDWIPSVEEIQITGGNFGGRTTYNDFPVLADFNWRTE